MRSKGATEREPVLIYQDCLIALKRLPTSSVDLICTDPPYGYAFMGKAWDIDVPSVDIWRECLRVLKPGGFCFVMSSPRQDVLTTMIGRLNDAGFTTGFTSIYWTYASGFPKAANMGPKADKRFGVKSMVIGRELFQGTAKTLKGNANRQDWYDQGAGGTLTPAYERKVGTSKAGRQLQGSYGGFQPKPAVEVVVVAMKPLAERSYLDQALANRKGVTWLDDGRIPMTKGVEPQEGNGDTVRACRPFHNKKGVNGTRTGTNDMSRFPANLLVSDGCLGPFGRVFDLDAWAHETFPFLRVPKASTREKNLGLNGRINHHPTVKPLTLMSYLITIGSRPGDTVLDPFVGSGTTCLAVRLLGRTYIGMESDREYVRIARARLRALGSSRSSRAVKPRLSYRPSRPWRMRKRVGIRETSRRSRRARVQSVPTYRLGRQSCL